MKLFYTTKYKYLADKLNINQGKIFRKEFKDGESLIHLKDVKNDIAGEDVYILGGTIDDKDTMDILDIACAASMLGAKSINIIIPYFGNARQDKMFEYGMIAKAKTRARYFSYIPRSSEGNRLYLLDLHADGIEHYFENGTHAIHMYGKKLVFEAIDDIIKDMDRSNFVLASTDEGRSKWVSSLAYESKLDVALVLKKRDGYDIDNLAINADVKDKNVIIYDDMLCSGNTLISAAKAYKACGAKDIYFIGTHGVLTVDNLFENSLIKKFYVSNSHPRILDFKDKSKLKIMDCSNIIMEYINVTK